MCDGGILAWDNEKEQDKPDAVRFSGKTHPEVWEKRKTVVPDLTPPKPPVKAPASPDTAPGLKSKAVAATTAAVQRPGRKRSQC